MLKDLGEDLITAKPNVSIQVWGLTEGKKSAVGIRETTVSKG
jgi:hypothetical protein